MKGAEALWTSTTLGSACDINPSRPQLGSLPDDTPVLFVPMAAVDDVTGEITAPEYRLLGEVRTKSYRTFAPSDVIFAKITPCMENGKSAIVPDIASGVGFGSTEFHVLRPHTGVNPRFIWHYLRQESFRRIAVQHMTGSVGQARVPAAFMEDFAIALPEPAIQDEIVRLLDVVTNLGGRAAIHVGHARQEVRRFREAVLVAACSGHLTAQWRDEHRRSSDSIRLRLWSDVQPLTETPDDWTWAYLEDIADVQGGVQKGAKIKVGEETREVAYLRVANVQRGWLDLSEIKTIVAPEARIVELKLRPGDILFNEGGDRDKLGRGWVWEGQLDECIHQNHVFRARLRDPLMQPRFYSWFGNSIGASYFNDQGKQTVNLASLSMTNLRALPVPVPTIEEQAEIVRRVDRLLSIADRLERRIEVAARRVEHSSQAALAKAFRGELTPGTSNNHGSV